MFFIKKAFKLEICNSILSNIRLVCAHIKTYITKMISFMKMKNIDRYIIQNVVVVCNKRNAAHRLMIVISPNDTESNLVREIALIDPGSRSVYKTSDFLYQITHQIYKCLDNNKITTSDDKTSYRIECPQLDSITSIQTMLSVNEKRTGACTVVTYLIVNVMVYMRINSQEALNIISATIVKKFILGQSIVNFADGYLLYLYNVIDIKQPLLHKVLCFFQNTVIFKMNF
jgi:hypothetical protein